MAAKGPTIPIYIKLESEQAIKDAQTLRKNLAGITKGLKKDMTGSDPNTGEKRMTTKQFKSWASEAAKLQTAMKGPAKSADKLKEKMKALEHILRTTNPDTKRWQKYSQQLEQVKNKYSELDKKIKSIGSQAKNVDAVNTSFQQQSTYIGRLLKRLVVYWGVGQATKFVRNIREVTAEFEKQEVALGALLQNVNAASILFERIKTFAVKSPFQIKELVTYTKQLSAFQIKQEELFDTTKRLADLSAGLGVDMGRLILAYGQVKSASVLRGQEVRQFTEAGIPLIQALADKFTELRGTVVSTAEVFDFISKRAVSFEMVKEIIEDMTDVGGQFYQMQERQAETLAGRWSNLKDTISIMYSEMGKTKSARTGINTIIEAISKMAQNWQKTGKVLRNSLVVLAAVKIASINTAIASKALTRAEAEASLAETVHNVRLSSLTRSHLKNTTAMRIELASTKLLTEAQLRAAMASNVLSRAFWKLTAAMAANPIGVFVVAAALAVSVLAKIARSLAGVKEEAKSAAEYAAKLQEVFDRYNKSESEADKMIKIYSELIKKEKRSLNEENRLRTIAKTLVARYGEAVVESRDAETGAITINIEKLKELIDVEKEYNRVALDKEVAEQQQRVADLREQIVKEEKKLLRWSKGGFKVGFNSNASSFGDKVYLGWASKKDRKELEDYIEGLREDIEVITEGIAEVTNQMENASNAGNEMFDGWKLKFSEYKDARNNTPAFFNEDIEGFETLFDGLEEAAKRYKEYNEKRIAMDNAVRNNKDKNLIESLRSEQAYAETMEKLYEKILIDFSAMSLVNSKSSGKTAADMFTELTKAQSDFFKDFKKNVEQMNRYVDKSSAIAQVNKLMEGRANELGIDLLQLDGSERSYDNQLKKLIDRVQAKVRQFSEAKGKDTLAELMGMKTKNEELQKYLNTLKDLWNIYTDNVLKDTEERMKKSFEEWEGLAKSAQVAKEFYDKMLDATGNGEFAANVTLSIYGEDGQKLDETLSNQLRNAFAHINLRNVANLKDSDLEKRIEELRKAGVDIDTTLDGVDEDIQFSANKIREYVNTLIDQKKWSELKVFLSALPEEARKAAESMISNQQQSDADWLLEISKTYAKAKDYEDKLTDIKAKAEKDRAAIREKGARLGLSDMQIASQVKAVTNKEQADLAALDLEILKNSEEWEKAFEKIDRIGRGTVDNLISLIDDLIEKYKAAGVNGENALTPEALKTLMQARNKLETRLEALNPFEAFKDGRKEFASATKQLRFFRKQLDGLKENAEGYAKTLESINSLEDERSSGLDKMKTAVNNVNEAFNSLSSIVSSLQTIFEQLGMDEDSNTAAVLDGIAKAITLIGSALMFVNAALALMELNPVVLAITALIAAVTAMITVTKNLKINKANREIKAQEQAIKNLQKAYEELEAVMGRSFGSDVITSYNAQIANLEARIKAVKKQSEAEKGKGKSADEDAIAEYENTVADLEKEIEDKVDELRDHFSGTDLTSAARDFAESWIEAYKEFGNTTTAMSEKFQDMVQTMITESLAGRAMQTLLEPIFRAIDEAARSGGELTAAEIADISKMAEDTIPSINDSMINLMNALKTAGLDVRQQAAGMTGISRDIAGASEESILGLAAGINTQNFYIAQTNDYVFQILTILRGGAISALGSSGAIFTNAGETYLSTLPTIAGHTASILEQCQSMVEQCQSIATSLNRVVQPRGTTGSHWVVTS